MIDIIFEALSKKQLIIESKFSFLKEKSDNLRGSVPEFTYYFSIVLILGIFFKSSFYLIFLCFQKNMV